MADHSRRASSATPVIPPPPPPPPPFPTRSLRYNNAFTKFITQPFNYAARPPTQHDGDRPPTSLPRIVGPLSSQNATHRTGLEISALDLSPDRTRAILAGREILKTILVDGTKCAEEFNLLSAMRQYASHNSARARPKDALDIHDVKWSHSTFDTLIATAASSGRVVLYDINRPGVELARLHEHPRQVHKVAFNPHHGALLLSGSQDGTTKLWDMRDLKRAVGVCPSQYTHNGQSDGVRDVKWSPTDGVEFAFGTDGGIVQRWDYRQSKAPKLKINAHNRACYAIDWHPDGTHLVSAGLDKTLRVWNFASDARRQKPAWTLQAPYPVLHVRWRPPCRSSEAQDHRAWQSTHLVTSYDRDHSAVHVWDFRRPNIPFRELLHYNAAPTDLLWHSQDLLWTVGREGVFNQTDIKFAPKPTDRRNLQAFAVAAHGELTCVAGEAPSRKTSVVERNASPSIPNSSTPKGLSPEKGSFGRSLTDDSIDEGFLSSSFKKRHARSGSNRSIKSLSNTPPSYDDIAKIKPLDETLPRKDTSNPNQTAGRSLTAAGIANPLLFTLLAHTYISSLPEGRDTRSSLSSISKVLESNSWHAKRAGFHRIAQSFKTLHRILLQPPAPFAVNWLQLRDKDHSGHQSHDISHSSPVARQHHGLSNMNNAGSELLEKTAATENSSNAATPLARPRPDDLQADPVIESRLEDPNDGTSLILPPSLVETTMPSQDRASTSSPTMIEQTPPSFDDGGQMAVEDFDERRKSNNWRVQPKIPLDIEPSSQGHDMYIRPIAFDRQDSNESFPMFSAFTGSYRNSFRSSSSGALSRDPASIDSRRESDTRVAPDSQRGNDSSESLQTSGSISFAAHQSPQKPILNMSGVADDGIPMSINSSDLRDLSKHSDQQIYSMTSTSSSPEELRLQSANLRATPSSNTKLGKRQSITFASDAGIKDDYLNTGPPALVPVDKSSQTTGQSPVKEQSTSEHLASQTLPKILAAGSWDSLTSVAGLLLPQLMSYHTNQSPDAQFAAHVLLLLSPFLSGEYSSLSSRDDGSHEKGHVSIDPSIEEAQKMMNMYQEKLKQLGMSPLHVESIMITYHDQLVSLRLFNTATQFRRLCYPLYPSVYDQFQGRTQVGFLCQLCKNPINSLSRDHRCGICKSRQSSCPICWSDHSPFENGSSTGKDRSRRWGRSRNTSIASARHNSEMTPMASSSLWGAPPLAQVFAAHFTRKPSAPPSRPPLPEHVSSSHHVKSRPSSDGIIHSKLYTTCVLCNHSAHASCHRAWLTDMSDGGCPTPGCLCDCARGTWRDAKREMREERLGGYRFGAVTGDKWGVRESRAVTMVRGTLGAGGSGRSDDGRRVRVVDPSAD